MGLQFTEFQQAKEQLEAELEAATGLNEAMRHQMTLQSSKW